MASRLFVDTWGWLTLRDKREVRHQEVTAFYRQRRLASDEVVTTDYVLDETFTLIYKRLPRVQAQDSMRILLQAIESGYTRLEWITPDRFARTLRLKEQLQDKPNISFTDLSSMVVMEEFSISMILTGDAHFTHVGKGFQLAP